VKPVYPGDEISVEMELLEKLGFTVFKLDVYPGCIICQSFASPQVKRYAVPAGVINK